MSDPLITQAAIEAATEAFVGVSTEDFNANWGVPEMLRAAVPKLHEAWFAALAAQAGENPWPERGSADDVRLHLAWSCGAAAAAAAEWERWKGSDYVRQAMDDARDEEREWIVKLLRGRSDEVYWNAADLIERGGES